MCKVGPICNDCTREVAEWSLQITAIHETDAVPARDSPRSVATGSSVRAAEDAVEREFNRSDWMLLWMSSG